MSLTNINDAKFNEDPLLLELQKRVVAFITEKYESSVAAGRVSSDEKSAYQQVLIARGEQTNHGLFGVIDRITDTPMRIFGTDADRDTFREELNHIGSHYGMQTPF